MGFGDELEAALLTPGESYPQAVQRIRGEQQQYRQVHPYLSTGAELAGGLATGGGLAGLATKGVRGASAVARALGGSAALQGAVSGAGAAEGGLKERAIGAGIGGTVGGVTGAVLGKGVQAIGTRLARGGRTVPPAVQAVEEAMEASRQTPTQLAERARQVAAVSPEARVMDVLGEPGVRIARRIEALGGEGGETVGATMRERLTGRPERLQGVLSKTTGRGRENIVETLEDSIQRGKAESAPLYEAFYRHDPQSSAVIDDVLQTPFGQEVLARARRNAANEKRLFIEPAVPLTKGTLFSATGEPLPITLKQGQAAKYTPQAVDDIKKAMDDLIYETRFAGVSAGQGGLKPGEKRAAASLRKEFVDAADAAFPGYAKARKAWAGEKALRDAMEEGVDVASTKANPDEIRQAYNAMEEGQKEYFQRGFLDGLRQKVDNGALRPSLIRTAAFKKNLQVVYGKQADTIAEALLTDVALTESAGKIVGGSRTAPLQSDIAAELSGSKLRQAATMGRQLRSDPMLSVLQGIDYLSNLRNAPVKAAERAQKATALMRPASQMSDILRQVEQEYAARQAGRTAGQFTGGVTGGMTGRAILDLMNARR